MGGARMFGKYELVEELGRGGMAEVWKAKIRGVAGFERTLVIKRILPSLVRDEEFVAMFVREAQLCSMLSHANIVQVYELGELEGEYYLAMEYVRGRDLHALMRARPKEAAPPGLAAIVGRDVGRALAYAYGLLDESGKPLRLIHRDVTPSNVMLTFDGGTKLVDFGVAKAMAKGGMTAVGSIKGKLSYMSPEQITGGDIDQRSDLFALGILMHETLTGRRLFKGDDDEDTVHRVLGEPIQLPSKVNPAVPAALDACVMRALERDPHRRYQSGDELADALEACVHQMKWGPTQLAALVRERFPDAETSAGPLASVVTDSMIVPPTQKTPAPSKRPAPRTASNPFADATEYDGAHFGAAGEPTESATSDRTGHSVRATLSLVRTIDEQGAWTSDVDLPALAPSPPITAQPIPDTGDFLRIPDSAIAQNPWPLRVALITSVALFVIAGVTYVLHVSHAAEAIPTVSSPQPVAATTSPDPAPAAAAPPPVAPMPVAVVPTDLDALDGTPTQRSRTHAHHAAKSAKSSNDAVVKVSLDAPTKAAPAKPAPTVPAPSKPKAKGDIEHGDVLDPFN